MCATTHLHEYLCDMAHSYMCHDAMGGRSYQHVCDITCLCVWHVALIWVAWLCVSFRIHLGGRTHAYMYSFICMTWLIYMCAMTHSHVWMTHRLCDSCRRLYVPWLIYMCAMTHSHVWMTHRLCDSRRRLCVPWLILMCAMTHSHVWMTHRLR